MTNTEIEKLLDMLNKKGLEDTKNFLIREKFLNDKRISEKAFQEYMTNKGVSSDTVTYYIDKDNMFIFTNGISIYYINKKFFTSITNLTYKLVENQNEKHILYYHRIFSMKKESLEEAEENLKAFKTSFVEAQYIEKLDNNYTLLQNYDERFEATIEHTFSTREINLSKKLLGNSKIFIDEKKPLAYKETKLGKCYILGIKKS